MAYKHLKQYYDTICNDYVELNEILQYKQELFANSMVSEQELKDMMDMVDKVKENYERWSYMMFLVNMPNKKDKKFSYQKQNAKKLAGLSKNNSIDSVLKEDRENLDGIKNFRKDG